MELNKQAFIIITICMLTIPPALGGVLAGIIEQRVTGRPRLGWKFIKKTLKVNHISLLLGLMVAYSIAYLSGALTAQNPSWLSASLSVLCGTATYLVIYSLIYSTLLRR